MSGGHTSLRPRLVLGYALAVLVPALLYALLYRPQRARTAAGLDDLGKLTEELQKKTRQLAEFPAQLAMATPPRPPPAGRRLDALGGVHVPGLSAVETARRGGTAQVSLRGGGREVAAWLEAVQSLPFPPRLESLALLRSPEPGVLVGVAIVEAAP